jgi:hypothetical protein
LSYLSSSKSGTKENSLSIQLSRRLPNYSHSNKQHMFGQGISGTQIYTQKIDNQMWVAGMAWLLLATMAS